MEETKETKFQEVIWDDEERKKLKNCMLVYFQYILHYYNSNTIKFFIYLL